MWHWKLRRIRLARDGAVGAGVYRHPREIDRGQISGVELAQGGARGYGSSFNWLLASVAS
jgi:hypothetical protein